MKKWVLDISCGLLIVLFVYAAVTKLADRQHFEAVLSKMLLIENLGGLISIVLPTAELFVSVLLLIPVTRLQGLYASVCLLILFTLYIGYMILFAKNLPCNCGGVLEKMNWHQHLIFNFFFIILSVTGIKIYQADKNIIAIQRKPDQQPQGKS
jgi:hypothetical protein